MHILNHTKKPNPKSACMVFVIFILPIFDTDMNSQIKFHLKVLHKGEMSVMLYSLMTETL